MWVSIVDVVVYARGVTTVHPSRCACGVVRTLYALVATAVYGVHSGTNNPHTGRYAFSTDLGGLGTP